MAGVLLFPDVTRAVSLTTFVTNPFDSTALVLAGIVNIISVVVGRLLLLVIEMIIVPILGYNGFADAQIVDLGWSLVRDVVNMGVVIILIVIAVMTIIGSSKANWTQQLPRLFIGVILVNFSRLIVGVLIDISQVVMFTFVNAIIDIAAGNFAQMLNITQFGSFSEEFIEKVNEKGTGIEAYEYLGSSYLQLALFLAIFGVLLLLALMFIWRIVLLWILLILAPAAFFLNGIQGMFKAADGYYGEWWKNLTSALILGPILTFFLWLALAAASGSNLAVTQQFPVPEEKADTGLALENFALDSLLGTFVALALLVAGMKFASSAASTMGGPVAKYISEDMGKKIAKGAVALPAGLANRAIGKGMDRFAAKNGLPQRGTLSSHLLSDSGKMLNRGAGTAAKIPLIGGYIGGAMAGMGGAALNSGSTAKAEYRKKAAEKIKNMNAEQRDVIMNDMLTDEKRIFNAMSPEEQEAFHVYMATNLGAQKDGEKSLENKYATEARHKLNQDPTLSEATIAGDPLSLSYRRPGSEEYEAERVRREAEKKRRTKEVEDEAKAKARSDFEKGVLAPSFAFTEKVKDQVLDGGSKDALSAGQMQRLHLIQPKDGQNLETAILEFLEKAKADGKANLNLASAVSLSNASVQAALGKFSMRDDKDGNKVYALQDFASGRLGTAAHRAALSGVKVDPSKVFTQADFDISDRATESMKNAVAGGVKQAIAGGAIGKMDTDTLNAFRKALKELPANKVSVVTRVDADSQMLKAGQSADQVYNISGGLTGQTALRIETLIKRDVTQVSNFANHVPDGLDGSGKADALSNAIVDAVSKESVANMVGQFGRAEGPELDRLNQSVEAISKAVANMRAEIASTTIGGGRVDKDLEQKVKNLERSLRTLDKARRDT